MSDSATPWTVARQAPLSRGFPRQEYWSGLPFPPPGYLPNPGIEPMSPESLSLVGGFFTTEPPGKLLTSRTQGQRPAKFLLYNRNQSNPSSLHPPDGLRWWKVPHYCWFSATIPITTTTTTRGRNSSLLFSTAQEYSCVWEINFIFAMAWTVPLPTNSYVANLNTQCDGIRSWGLWEVIRSRWGHENGTLMMGLIPF